MNAVAQLGRRSVGFVEHLGRLTVFGAAVLRAALTPPLRGRAFLAELHKLGVRSLVIIGVSGFAVGMVLGLQGYNTLVRFGATESLGAVVGLSLIRELGPVLTGLLATGRAGSASPAEIGAMVVTDQLAGLRMMSIEPIHLVVMPRALAMVAVMPLLCAIFIVAGLWGGYLIGVGVMGVDGGSYLTSLESSLDVLDHEHRAGLKTVVFGVEVGQIKTIPSYT
jgi:phospholipid/cholesterol/gamma-HCH transport system permease protein